MRKRKTGWLIDINEIAKGQKLPVGARVSYGDMANPRQVAIVVEAEIKRGYGQKCVFVEDYHSSYVSQAAIDGLGGWKREKGEANKLYIEALVQKAEQKKLDRTKASEMKAQKREAAIKRGAIILETEKQKGAVAVIVAELRKNQSDLMTDYHGSTTKKTIILAFSKHTRNLFSEMRKAAKTSEIEEINRLATASKECEHRENYSGGGGYYLAEGWKHATGWKVEKWTLAWGEENVKEILGNVRD